MIIECPHCSQSLEISRDLAGSTGTCPSCSQEMAFPGIDSFAGKGAAGDPPILRSRASKNYIRSGSRYSGPVKSVKKFSLRLLVLRILTILMMVGIVAYITLILLIGNSNFETGIMGGIQIALLRNSGLDSWEELTPGISGMLVGRQMIPALLVVIGLFAVFKRMRKTMIVIYFILFLQQLGIPSLPIIPVICLVLASIPGRSKIWEQ